MIPVMPQAVKYSATPVDQSGHLGSYNDITPCGGPYSYSRDRANECGFGGICSSPQVPGLLAASTLSEKRGDIVFISRITAIHGRLISISLIITEFILIHHI